MEKVFVFPDSFGIKDSTADKRYACLKDKEAATGIGEFIEIHESDSEISKIITMRKPDWVVAVGASATACLTLHGQKKILINPVVTENDLNNVTEYAREHTYGFFGALPEQEKSYELFQIIYPNASWFVNAPCLSIMNIKDIILEIIGNKSTND